jgi:hypothetical protein
LPVLKTGSRYDMPLVYINQDMKTGLQLSASPFCFSDAFSRLPHDPAQFPANRFAAIVHISDSASSSTPMNPSISFLVTISGGSTLRILSPTVPSRYFFSNSFLFNSFAMG